MLNWGGWCLRVREPQLRAMGLARACRDPPVSPMHVLSWSGAPCWGVKCDVPRARGGDALTLSLLPSLALLPAGEGVVLVVLGDRSPPVHPNLGVVAVLVVARSQQHGRWRGGLWLVRSHW